MESEAHWRGDDCEGRPLKPALRPLGAYPVHVGKNETLPSVPVTFLSCEACGAAIFLGDASKAAHASAALLHLEKILRAEEQREW